MQEAEVVGDFLFPADQQSPGSVHPGVGALDLPAASFSTAMMPRNWFAAFHGDVRNVTAFAHLLFNRLAEPAARLDARIADYYKRLAALLPAGQLMSGRGSSLFALCRSPNEAERIKANLRDKVAGDLFRVFAVRGCV